MEKKKKNPTRKELLRTYLTVGPWCCGLAAVELRRRPRSHLPAFHIRRNGRPAYKRRFHQVADFWDSPQGPIAGVNLEGCSFTIQKDGTKAFYQ